ncbi:hypothetical protein HWD99_02080 [Microbacterium sp. C5A9]|uniref:hypothetical protein n=1 Tax=Microbacterium sp. C5A9 TaxID=2736663 RepID=UPI001F525B06|nr:hypothetical protein [Microbacterium sp. C5A9]MCI1017406.1 hypothetical protein [Microbacterium sp. C5A9]
MKSSTRYSIGAVLAAVALGGGLSGCTPPEAVPSAAPEACEGIAMMLTTDDPLPHAGQTVSVSITPAGCDVDEHVAGEVIVRTADGDTSTGARLEIGSTTVSVDLPPHLTGTAMLMLVPDRDCESVADCHYPYADLRIRP